ncbi:MAG: hypothetical protein ACXAEU_04200 [Candidatus Hodarchaeales archaeon]|jgi:hypothetical protein
MALIDASMITFLIIILGLIAVGLILLYSAYFSEEEEEEEEE